MLTGMPAASDLRDAWFAPDGAAPPALARKHRIAQHVRALIDGVVGLDPDESDPDELDDIEQLAQALVARVQALPDLRRHGSLAAAPAPTGALVERSPVSGRGNPLAVPLRYRFDGALTTAWATFSSAYEGPPGAVHGGYVAAALDEVLGVAQIAAGAAGFTGTLTVRYRRPTPIRQRVDYEAGVGELRGRKLTMWARSTAGGTVVAEAEGLFIAQTRFGLPPEG